MDRNLAMIRSASLRSSSPQRSDALRALSPDVYYSPPAYLSGNSLPGSPYRSLHEAISSRGRRVSPQRTIVRPAAPIPVSPPVDPPVERTPEPEPVAVPVEPEPEPEPKEVPPPVVPTVKLSGIKADLEKRLKEINMLLKTSRETIIQEVNKMEELEQEKEGIERQLLSMIPDDAEPKDTKEVDELRAALRASENEVAKMKAREQNFDTTLNDLRKQLEEVTKALLEERSKKPVSSPAPVRRRAESESREYPVVGLELSEGAPYNIDGVWIVSVSPKGPAAAAGLEKGDIITEVSGIPIRTRDVFRKVIASIEAPKAGESYTLPFCITRESNGVPVPKMVNVNVAWAMKKPDGKRTITVQLSPRLGKSRSPSPPKIKRNN